MKEGIKMTTMNIAGKEHYLNKIFCDDFKFNIPRFQRPYSWTKEEAEELFDDLWSACMDDNLPLNEKEPYFLGSMVLIKGEGSKSDVIDGQQRLTTLTILFSVLRQSISNQEFSDNITSLLQEKNTPLMDLKGDYRLTLRDKDAEFFRKYIQEKDGLLKLAELQHKSLPNDPKHNIWENATCFRELLISKTQDDIILFTKFVIQKCILVVVSTPSLDSAYKIFSVMNDRGLDLTNSDILKAEIIGAIDNDKDQELYENKWVEIEEQLKRDLFNDLFTHIRMIYQKRKAKSDILKEFRDGVQPSKKPMEFIDDVLSPYGDMLSIIKSSNYKSSIGADKINYYLKWLNRIDNSDWVPPALVGMKKHQNDPVWLEQFFKQLDRLVSIMFLTRANINERLDRFGKIITYMETDKNIINDDSPMNPSSNEIKESIQRLDGNIYDISKICKYVLLRLNDELSDGGVTYDYPIISIEHVLPQNPKNGSEWSEWYPTVEARNLWLHRLGNLVLLSRKKNSLAQNFDFTTKKNEYFRSDKVTSFALTTQVLNEGKWTEDVIEERHRRNINILKKVWNLH